MSTNHLGKLGQSGKVVFQRISTLFKSQELYYLIAHVLHVISATTMIQVVSLLIFLAGCAQGSKNRFDVSKPLQSVRTAQVPRLCSPLRRTYDRTRGGLSMKWMFSKGAGPLPEVGGLGGQGEYYFVPSKKPTLKAPAGVLGSERTIPIFPPR